MSSPLFFRGCPVCRETMQTGKPICDECVSKLKLYTAFCRKCGYPIEAAGYECERCRDKIVKNAKHIYASYHYCDVIRKLLLEIKFNYNIHSAKSLFSIIVLPKINMSIYDAVIPVPSHLFRRFRRFYHPTDLVAKYISSLYDIKLDYALKRRRYTDFQFKLSKDHRYKNVDDAFIYVSETRYKKVLLVDDIITTGSTLEECAKVLKASGAKYIDCYALCKAVNKS